MAGDSGEQGLVVVDTREILTLPLPYIEGGNLKFPEAFVSALKGNFDNSLQTEQSRFRIAAIIVDPGHGGKDSGAIGTHTIGGKTLQVVEKDVTLRVSKMLYARLAAAYPDKRIIMTREGDTFPALEDRVNIANGVPLKENEAIIYISIHANASFTKSARGYEVWYLSPETRRTVIDQDRYADSTEVLSILNEMLEEEFTTESIMIAQSILEQFKAVLGNSIPSRGLKAEDWYVVKNSRMPSVLVELGFVTNEADALLLTEEAPLQKFSEALYKGIMDFITVFERSGGFTSIE
jgi:N-acetylmuramoyl-L-alanine amidase